MCTYIGGPAVGTRGFGHIRWALVQDRESCGNCGGNGSNHFNYAHFDLDSSTVGPCCRPTVRPDCGSQPRKCHTLSHFFTLFSTFSILHLAYTHLQRRHGDLVCTLSHTPWQYHSKFLIYTKVNLQSIYYTHTV